MTKLLEGREMRSVLVLVVGDKEGASAAGQGGGCPMHSWRRRGDHGGLPSRRKGCLESHGTELGAVF